MASKRKHLKKGDHHPLRRGPAGIRNLLLLILGAVVLVVVLVWALTRPAGPSAVLTPTAGGDTISLDDAYQEYQQGVFLLDVRTQEEWDGFHVENTTHIPLDELETRLGELPQGERIIVICNSGNRSDLGRDILLENGFTDVTSMDEGVSGWADAGFPIVGTRP